MAQKQRPQAETLYGSPQPNFTAYATAPVIAKRDPVSTDTGYPLGQTWVNKLTGSDWTLTKVAAGAATWAAANGGDSDVNTINSLLPTGGDIVIAGTTNEIDIANAGSTITLSVPTTFIAPGSIESVTSLTVGTNVSVGGNLTVTGDLVFDDLTADTGTFTGTLDVAGAVTLATTGASVNTIGNSTGATSVTVTSGSGGIALTATNAAITANSGTGTIGVSTDATNTTVNLGTGAGVKAVTLGSTNTSSSTTVQSGSGALAVTSTGGTLTINSGTGALGISTDASATTISIGTGGAVKTISVGGTSANVIAIANTQTAGSLAIGNALTTGTVTIGGATNTGTFTFGASTAAGGQTINIGNAANTGAQVINIAGGASGANSTVNVLSGNGTAGTQTLNVLTGNRAGALNLATGAAAHVIAVGSASAGAVTVDTAAGISLDAATVSNFTVTGAGADLNLLAVGGSVLVDSTEDAALAIRLHANGGTSETIQIHADQGTGAASIDVLSDVGGITLTSGLASADAINVVASSGGVDVDAALQINIASSQNAVDAIRIVSSAGGIDIDAVGAATEDINITNTGGSIVLVATESVTDAIVIQASGAAGGIDLIAGTNGVAVTGNTSITGWQTATDMNLTFSQSPIMQSNLTTGVAPTGATGDVNLMMLQDGFVMQQFILGAGQTIIAPRMGTTGLLTSLDLTNAEGAEYNFGNNPNNKFAFTIGTSAAFYMELAVNAADVGGLDPFVCGFRKQQANAATFTDYTDFATIGARATTAADVIVLQTDLNNAGETITNTTDAWTDGQTKTFRILVSAAGVVTYTIDGVAPTVTAAFTFDNGDVVTPFIRHTFGAATPAAINWISLKIGFQ